MQSQIDPELPEETSGPNIGKILISRLRQVLGFARDESSAHGTAIEVLLENDETLAQAINDLRTSTANRLVYYPNIPSNIINDALLSNPILDHTFELQNSIDACPSGYTLSIPKANWRFTNLLITKSIVVDWNGSSIICDPTPFGVTTGNPAMWFKGTNTTNFSFNTLSTTSSVITLTTPADASNFPVGALVRIKDSKRVYNWADLDQSGTADPTSSDANGAPGYQDRWEVNWVVSSNSSTGAVGLSRPTEWAYDTNQTISVINKLDSCGVINITNISEVDPGGVFNGADVQQSPHLIKFDYCNKPFVDSVTASNFNLHAVNFDTCDTPSVTKLSAINPYRPTTGGHGYGIRFNRCSNGLAKYCYGIKVRHLVDTCQSYQSGSKYCISYSCAISAYAMHGLGEKRCFSVNDVAYTSGAYPGSTGWAIGNPSFSASYQTEIINPTFIGSGTGAVVGYLSDNTHIINPQFKGIVAPGSSYTFRGVMVATGAINTVIRDGYIDAKDVRVVGSECITARNNVVSADTIAVKPDSLTIDNVAITGAYGDAATSMYSVHISQCTNTTLKNNQFISVANNQQGVDVLYDSTNNALTIEDNLFRGTTRKYGIIVNIAPLQIYKISGNTSDTSYSISYLSLVFSNLLIETNNAPNVPQVLTYAATVSPDMSYNAAGGRAFEKTEFGLTLTGNAQLGNPSTTPLRNGRNYKFVIKQDGIGGRTLAYQSLFKFPGGAPTLSTAPNAVDVIDAVWNSTNGVFYCVINKNLS